MMSGDGNLPAREEALFQAAVSLPAGDRATFLDRECARDPSFRARLEALLAAHDLPDPLFGTEAGVGRPTINLDLAHDLADDLAGQTIGRYRLLEKIGEGGCGVVYVAEQTAPLRRRVALKVIKLGMDTREVIARFDAERQALAMMDHPSIAKVLDAGTTGDAKGRIGETATGQAGEGSEDRVGETASERKGGTAEGRPGAAQNRPFVPSPHRPLAPSPSPLPSGRPYFVMELVRGIKITNYCDQNDLSTRERLNLFIKVCHAIQHAHQKGIIHRDIKPSNILVAYLDGMPVPKVIDFGIAKAIEGRLTDATVYTQLHQFIGTPAYMSPEQAEMTGLDIDTRSDIYSLGVLLYELLTGTTPFDAKELMSQGIDAMRRTIREEEPLRPSTRLRQSSSAPAPASGSRITHQASLPTDLDWIVMKCLEKDRARRYATANGLAADIQRHLNHEPVVARPPSAGYRFQKAFRRNRVAFAAVAAVGVALLAGISLALWQAKVARGESERARWAEEAWRKQTDKAQQGWTAASEAQAKAEQQHQRAEQERETARRYAYTSDLNLAYQRFQANNLGSVLELLDGHRPTDGQSDLRHWEWRYLWRQTRSDALFTLCAGTYGVGAVAFSSDGELLAVSDGVGGGVRFWSVAQRRELVPLRIERGCAYGRGIAFSAVGRHFAASTATANGRPTLKLWDLASVGEVATLLEGDLVLSVSFSADGQLLAAFRSAGGNRDRVTVWEVQSRTVLTNIAVAAQTVFHGVVQFSPHGHLLAIGDGAGRIRFHDPKGGPLPAGIEASAKGSGEGITALTFSPDGEILASASGLSDTVIKLWEVETGRAMATLHGHRAYVHALAFSPLDGGTLASASADQTIRLWDVASCEETALLAGHRMEVWSLAYSPDGNRLASGGKDGSVCFWDASPAKSSREPRLLPAKVKHAEFAPDSRTLATIGLTNGAVTLWDVASGSEIRPLPGLGTNNVELEFSPGGDFLLAGDAGGVTRVWSLEGQRLAGRPLETDMKPISLLSFLPGGKFLAAASVGYGVELWECGGWTKASSWRFNAPYISTRVFIKQDLAISPDGRLIARAQQDGTVKLWDLWSGADAGTLCDQARFPSGIAFTPDGTHLFTSSTLGVIQIWDLVTTDEVWQLWGHLTSMESLAVSPDGLRLVSPSQNELRIWDAVSRREVATLPVQGQIHFLTAFSPDGNSLVVVDKTGIAQVWSAPTLAEIEAVESAGRKGTGTTRE